MSAICGWVGEAPPETLAAMLAAVEYRGDTSDTVQVDGIGLGYRFWRARTGRAQGIHNVGRDLTACAGTLAPVQDSPAKILHQRLVTPTLDMSALGDLDGAFAAACWDGERRRLSLLRDPFGVRSLYYVEHQGTFYFATELKQLLAIPRLPIELDYEALHKYLTFSFVPGNAVPLQGVRRLLPGQLAVFTQGKLEITPYFTLTEAFPPDPPDQAAEVRRLRRLGQEAVTRRLTGESEVGLYLSGGLDSSAVALWLKEAGVAVHALSLDFGEHNIEREHAKAVAQELGLRFDLVQVGGADVAAVFPELVDRLDLPFGDAVTGPQYLLGRAARKAGLQVVFNGEGGDQLFGGWTTKPMIAAAIYSQVQSAASPEEMYLQSYHRFYGLEDSLYTPEFRDKLGGPGQRRALLSPYLGNAQVGSFLNRVRLADIALKGSQNILPRAERMTSGWGLDIRTPLFDRRLAEYSFTLPPQMKLHGACEKYILKLAMQGRLPEEIVWRPKSGMSVPMTDWVLGPLAPILDDLLSPAAVKSRGLFRPAYIARLRAGRDEPGETRRRRLGEKLWALAMLEAWLRHFYDRRALPRGGSQ